jgi:anti-sigma factor RsiW
MSGRQRDQMIERVCDRLHGEMNEAEAALFDLELKSDPVLAKCYREIAALDNALIAMPVLTPSATFTASVLRKTRPVVQPEAEKSTWLDWVTGLAPAFGLLVIAVIWGRELWGKAVGEISEGAGWLDGLLGTNLFEQQPFILLGALIPVIVLAVAYAVMHEDWSAEA